MIDIKKVADESDMIINGYAFTKCEEGVKVLNLDVYGDRRRKILDLMEIF